MAADELPEALADSVEEYPEAAETPSVASPASSEKPVATTRLPASADGRAVTTTPVLTYLHPDHLGTPRLATDSSKRVIWRWDSAPFGDTLPAGDPDGDGLPFTLNLRFPGQYFDAETGLHYNYFRDYDPVTGRYLESDPIGLAGGLGTYGYVGGRPLGAVDSFGLKIEGEYFVAPRLTIKSIGYRSEVNYGDFQWDVTSMWRNGWVYLKGIGSIDFTVHCIDKDECGNIIKEWFVDRSFNVEVEKRFEIRQNLAGAAPYAYKLMEMKMEIEKAMRARVSAYLIDPTTWCIFSLGRFAR